MNKTNFQFNPKSGTMEPVNPIRHELEKSKPEFVKEAPKPQPRLNGAKDMVSDILAGFFIIFESTYKVGDYIKVGGWEGVVTEIGIRTTKVKFVTDVKVFNNSSLRDIVCSEEVVRQSVKIGISYDADFEEIERILKEELSKIGPEQIPGLRKGPTYTGISSFDESSIVLTISMFVEGNLKFPAVRALNREIKLIFDRNNIEIPFNQLVIHEAEKPVL